MNLSQSTAFEIAFAKWFNVGAAFAFWKARVALYAILKAFGVTDGDEVILPGYTCVMNVNPIKYLGATPVYVDIEPQTFNINPALIEAKISSKTRVIIAQNTYGYVCDMDKILTIAQKHKIPVIEDCCLCLGSTYKDKLAGTFGKAAYFSFQWNKPFTTGLGGVAVTNNEDLSQKIEKLCKEEILQPTSKEILLLAIQIICYKALIYPRTTALAQSVFRYLTKKNIVVGSSNNSEFEPIIPSDFFKKMGPIQAKEGLRQMHRLNINITHRQEIAAFYDSLLAEYGWPVRSFDRKIMNPVMVRFPVRVKEKNKAIEKAASAGIELGSWFECPLHPVETPLEKYDYTPGSCPEAEKASREVVNLPLHPRVNKRIAQQTVKFITCFTPVTT
jgi:dTDP-4-amino-4,6-dideoxygalactose transaminase